MVRYCEAAKVGRGGASHVMVGRRVAWQSISWLLTARLVRARCVWAAWAWLCRCKSWRDPSGQSWFGRSQGRNRLVLIWRVKSSQPRSVRSRHGWCVGACHGPSWQPCLSASARGKSVFGAIKLGSRVAYRRVLFCLVKAAKASHGLDGHGVAPSVRSTQPRSGTDC